jgi:dihydrofolate reductase
MRKIVASSTPLTFEWRNSEQLDGDLVEFVRKLKEEPGGVIGMSGSPSIVRQLMDAELLDELHLLVHPVVVRKGARLFDEGKQLPLKVLSSTTFETGVLYVVYGPDPNPPTGGYEEAVEALSKD